MKLKHKKVLLYGNDRLKKDFIYLFPKVKIYGNIVDNLLSNDDYILKDIDRKFLRNKIIVICERKNINILEKMLEKGLKEKKHYIFFEDLGYLLNDFIDKISFNIINFYNIKIKHYKVWYRYIPNSFYLKKMIYTDSRKGYNCEYPFKYMQVQPRGNVFPCCDGWTSKEIGNILLKKPQKVWNSKIAKLFRLSIINKTYIFCNPSCCPFLKDENIPTNERFEMKCSEYPSEVCVAIDLSCNLKCPSCRKNYCNINKGPKYIVLKYMAKKLVKSPITLKADKYIMASQGEVFFSKTYQKMLFDSKITKRDSITIHTNGTLLTKKNLKKLCDMYNDIKFLISVDAATEETYKKIRVGGNYKFLLKNLDNLSQARKEGKVNYVELLFVVQKNNYKEMPEFAKKAKKWGFDKVSFSKITNWNTYTNEEFKNISMYDENDKPKKELLDVLEDTIFEDDIVEKNTNILKNKKSKKIKKTKISKKQKC